MAGISSNDVVVAFKKLTTWGTAVALTSAFRLRCSSLAVSGGFGTFTTRDIGFAKKLEEVKRTTSQFQITISCDYTINQPHWALLASIMGTESVPAETTVSQGDYTRNIDLSDSISGSSMIAWSMGWSIEDATGAKIIELPSVKFFSFNISQAVNEVGTVQYQGIVDNWKVSSQTSTYANVTGNAATANYEALTLGGANHYCRMNDASGGSLSGSNDMPILRYSFGINRPVLQRYALRGANSAFSYEPLDLSQIEGTFEMQLLEINNTTLPALTDWAAGTAKKAEIFIDGAQIGSGVNASVKAQFPRLIPDPAIPSGYDVPNNNSLMQPTYRFRMVKAAAAPTGMSGVTDYLRIVPIDRRSTKWTA